MAADPWVELTRGVVDPTQTLRPEIETPVTGPPGDQVGSDPAVDYPIIDLLGSGGFGEVFLAEQRRLGRHVALKRIRAGLGDPRMVAALALEARTTAILEHPGVVAVHDAGPGWVVMQRLRGATFADWLKARPYPLPDGDLAAAIDILVRVADAVAHAHGQGIVHRDIKPANIMVGGFGEVVLLDWGLAVDVGATLPPEAACGGTPTYLAPEMARAEASAIGPASDVHLLGGTLFRILAGTAPYAAATVAEAISLSAAGLAHPLPADAPAALADLCRLAMRPVPAERPTASAFAAELHAWQRGLAHRAEATELAARASAALASPGTPTIWRQAAIDAERALGLWPAAADARHAGEEAVGRLADDACAHGDLVAARSWAAAMQDGDRRRSAQARIASAERHMDHRRRLGQAAMAAAVLGLVAVGTAGLFALHWSATSGDRDRLARAASAAALAAEARTALDARTADPEAAWLSADHAAAMARRADGLAPGAHLQLLVEAQAAAARAALARGAADLAEPDIAGLRQLGDPRADALASEAAAVRQAAAERAALPRRRWEDDFRRLTGLSDPLGIADGDVERAASLLASWTGDGLAEVVAGLAHGPHRQQIIAAHVLGRRPDLADAPLVPLLDAMDAGVLVAAVSAGLRRPDPPARALLAAQRRIADLLGWGSARRLAMLATDSGRLADAADARTVRDRLLLGDHVGAVRVADGADPDSRFLAAMIADRWLLDQPTARRLVEGLSRWEAVYLAVDLQRRSGDAAGALARIAAATAAGVDADLFLPERILVRRDLGDHDGAQADAERLAAMPAERRAIWRGAAEWIIAIATGRRLRRVTTAAPLIEDADDAGHAERLALLAAEDAPANAMYGPAAVAAALRRGDAARAAVMQQRIKGFVTATGPIDIAVMWKLQGAETATARLRAAWPPPGSLDPASRLFAIGLCAADGRLAEAAAYAGGGPSDGHVPGFAAMQIRLLLASGDGPAALDVLASPRLIREGRDGFDLICWSIPSLRAGGWPGCSMAVVHDMTLGEAAAAAARGDTQRAQVLLGTPHLRPDLSLAVMDAAHLADWCRSHPTEAITLGWPLVRARPAAPIQPGDDPAAWLPALADWSPTIDQRRRLAALFADRHDAWAPASTDGVPDIAAWTAMADADIAAMSAWAERP
jgi:hypothetical protein